jgi:CubicO group peptidase (beta-lactamase class C family)
MRRLFALFALLACPFVFAQAPLRTSEAAAIASFSERAAELAGQDQFSGQLLVARRGKILLDQSWGLADREGSKPVTADSMYGHNGGAPGMNGALWIYPSAGYGVIGLSNLDPDAATRAMIFFTRRMPLD